MKWIRTQRRRTKSGWKKGDFQVKTVKARPVCNLPLYWWNTCPKARWILRTANRSRVGSETPHQHQRENRQLENFKLFSHKQCSHWQKAAEVRMLLPPHGHPAPLTPGPYSPTYVQRHPSIKACSVMELARWHVPSWKFYWTSIQAIMLHFKKHIFLFFPEKTKYEVFLVIIHFAKPT